MGYLPPEVSESPRAGCVWQPLRRRVEARKKVRNFPGLRRLVPRQRGGARVAGRGWVLHPGAIPALQAGPRRPGSRLLALLFGLPSSLTQLAELFKKIAKVNRTFKKMYIPPHSLLLATVP